MSKKKKKQNKVKTPVNNSEKTVKAETGEVKEKVKGAKIAKITAPVAKQYHKLQKYRIFHNSYFQVFLLSVVITIIMELLSKRSLFKLVKWMFTSPVALLVNIMIVAIPLGFSVMFKHKYALYAVFSFIWIVIGVIDCAVISNRVTPFTANDLKVLNTVLDIVNVYVSPSDIIKTVIVVILVLVILVISIVALPKIGGNFKYKKKVPQGISIMVICFVFVRLAMKYGAIETKFVNLRNAYQDYGLAYCFTNSLFNTGVAKPSDYSDEKVKQIVDDIATGDDSQPIDPSNPLPPEAGTDHPNVIFVQLESFFDVNRLNGTTFTENPVPNMTKLQEECYSGLLAVPVFSAGTVNTEFEMLTGMNMDDFGPGEYPFKTVMLDTTTESLAYNLAANGYRTHAVHNNTARFYGRNVVYPNLGIETFTTVEYMVGVERNQLDWAKDYILTKYIDEALDSTPGQDFIFTVSVQGHGEYPDEDVLQDQSLLEDFNVEGDVGEYNFAYYVEQIHEMDEFVGQLVSYLEERDEKTVLVLYGDHLPGFNFEESDFNRGTLYDTEYVIWSNYDLGTPVHEDIEAYQLGSKVLSLLGIDDGVINKLHQNRENYTEEEYLDALNTLEYDMLYGEKTCWGGSNPYIAPEVKFGYDTIEILSIQPIYDETEDVYYLNIYGNFFTPYSKLFLNGTDKMKTLYVDEHRLLIPEIKLKADDYLIISQSNISIDTLSCTEAYIISQDELTNAKNNK